MPFRPALPTEPGVAFIDLLDARCGGDRRLRERLLAFLHQWDHLADELPGEPSAEVYAERWNLSVPSTYRILDEFRRAFPSERSPSRILELLWQGLASPYRTGPDLGSLTAVRVVPPTDSRGAS